MPNQYNAASLGDVPARPTNVNFGDGYPIQSASGVGGGDSVSVSADSFFPRKTRSAGAAASTIVDEYRTDAADTPHSQDRNPEPGNEEGSAAVAGAFDAGTGTEKVVNEVDAPFNQPTGHYSGQPNTDPFLGRDEDGVETPV